MWLEKLRKHRASTAEFFHFRSTDWIPQSEAVAGRFYRAVVRPQGRIILWPLLHLFHEVEPDFQLPKLAARSMYHPDMIRPQCEKFEKGGVMGEYDGEVLKRAYEKVSRMFFVGKLTPYRLGETHYVGSANAGLPTLLSKAEVYPESVRESRMILKGKCPPPTVLFHRGKDEEKARFVNGYPFAMTLLESKFFDPYQLTVKLHHTPYAGGRADFEVAGFLNEVRTKSRFILEMDYSNFDGSVSSRLIRMAFRIIRDNFVFEDLEDEKAWNIVVKYFISGPMLAPDGRIYSGRRHGVPSGSMFTQIVDSIVNALCIEYLHLRLGVGITRYLVLGDDSVTGLYEPTSISRCAAILAELGIKVNEEKSRLHTMDEEVHFLGHEWNRMVAERDVTETLVRLLTPERNRTEYWSKNPEVRRRAYIERIRAYQEDNPRAWVTLQKLLIVLKHGALTQLRFLFDFQEQFFQSAEVAERARWDLSKRARAPNHHRGQTAFL